MATPSLEDLLGRARGDEPLAIPIYREILADLDTPVSAFMKVGQRPWSFLLESVEGGERWARYSFIGSDPALVVRATGSRCVVEADGEAPRVEERADPLTLLAEVLGRYRPVPVPGLPPFAGGAVGWLAWDAVRWWERLPDPHPAGDAPTMVFAVPRSLVIFDNLRHRILVTEVVLWTPGEDLAAAYARAVQRIDDTIARLRGPLPEPAPPAEPPGPVASTVARADFEAAVRRIKEYIRAGDCIQVVLSQRFDFDFDGDPFAVYRALRAINPSPYMFFLRYPDQLVVGASPEVMVRVQGDEALVAPIAGTRRRGATEGEDLALERELLADPKERAEHVMLVDLGRNDLGRVAAPGSVRVDDLMHVERYSHVMHIVSTVQARLREGRDGFDAVRATFPAGTLSGAPKVRAMQIIDELEPAGRGLYGGAVGYVGFGGTLDLCIAIRTAVGREGRWSMQVGAGVVADSDPAAEYQETLNKAGGLRRALELVGSGL
ncbi:MAG: anthranilate synthase component I [Alphaproteobacteria bacterium]|nr:anthranilate synthase component I [Alphaproteobacteria bacterium]